jgi:hypothetical protein
LEDGEPFASEVGVLSRCGRIVLRTAFAGLLFASVHAAWAAVPTDQTSNGLPKRPFYIIGHNPNTPDLAKWDLDHGANAMEPDVSYVCCGKDPTVLGDLSTVDTDAGAFPRYGFVDWLEDLRSKIYNAQTNGPGSDRNYTNLAALFFDCKSRVCVKNSNYPEYITRGGIGNGIMILEAIRTHLTDGMVNPPIVMISCGDVEDAKNLFEGFDQDAHLIIGTNDYGLDTRRILRANEGLMIDMEPNVDDVINYFRNTLGFTGNIGYGAGSSAGPARYMARHCQGAWMPPLPRGPAAESNC